MKTKNKILQLRNKIREQLLPLIDADYVYLDIPFHQNIGDILIWEGTEHFLSQLSYKCIFKDSLETFDEKVIPESAIILMHGGGNFGDIWETHQNFRLSIIQKYKRNKIIILPQTVHYNDLSKMKRDALVLQSHSNLTVCARDKDSYKLLQDYKMGTNVLLVPDMAFYISEDILYKYRVKTGTKTLFIKRKDKELHTDTNYKKNIKSWRRPIISDWPTYECDNDIIIQNFWEIKNKASLVEWKEYAEKTFKPHLIKLGCKFISKYRKVYTTRLHGAILSMLLDKKTIIFDNSYGKNVSFYNTWLVDSSKVCLAHESFGKKILSMFKKHVFIKEHFNFFKQFICQ